MPRTPKTKSKTVTPAKSASPAPPSRPGSKAAAVITLLKAKRGTTIPEMMNATGWQSHSVRGFIAGSLRTRSGEGGATNRTCLNHRQPLPNSRWSHSDWQKPRESRFRSIPNSSQLPSATAR